MKIHPKVVDVVINTWNHRASNTLEQISTYSNQISLQPMVQKYPMVQNGGLEYYGSYVQLVD